MYYKLDERKWHGPAFVIGTEGKNQVIVKHGGVLRRVHPCRLQQVESYPDEAKIDNEQNVDSRKHNNDSASSLHDDTRRCFDPVSTSSMPSLLDNLIHSSSDTSNDVVDSEIHSGSSQEIQASTQSAPLPVITERIEVPKKDQNVRYKYHDDENWKTVTVIGCGGKIGGRYQNWINIERDNGVQESLDWADVDQLEIIDNIDGRLIVNNVLSNSNIVLPVNENSNVNSVNNIDNNYRYDTFLASVDKINDTAVISHDNCKSNEFYDAKLDELNRLREFNAYDVVPYSGQKLITGRWVCTRKITPEGLVPRARFVIKGFQEKLNMQADSPWALKKGLDLFLAL